VSIGNAVFLNFAILKTQVKISLSNDAPNQATRWILSLLLTSFY